MRNLLIWCAILSVIGYGTFKGVAWYQVNRLILQIKKSSELHMAFRHGWISTSVFGEATIHDVEVTPFQLRKPVHADEVVIRFGSVFEMISAFSLDQSARFNPPSSMEIEWKGVNLPLSTQWGAYLPSTEIQKKFFGLACGDVESIGTIELEKMGYGNLSHDATLAYEFDYRSNSLQITFDILFEGMGQVSGKLDVQSGQGLSWPLTGAALPQLNSLQYSLEDKSFMRRVTLLCGKEAGYNRQEFIQASVIKTRDRLAKAGITISQPLLNAYSTFLEGDGIVEVDLDPGQSLNLARLLSMTPEQISEALNYSVRINRIRIPQGEFYINAGKLSDFLFPPAVVEKPKVTRPSVVEKAAWYQSLPLEYIDRYVGTKIRLTQRSGKVTEGILQENEKYRLNVGVPQESGSVLFHVSKSDIIELMVFTKDDLSGLVPVETEEEVKADPTAVLGAVDTENTTVVYEEGTDTETPLAEGEYFEVIEVVEEPDTSSNTPTINDLPLDKGQLGSKVIGQ